MIGVSNVIYVNQTERKRRKLKIVKIQKYVQVYGNTNMFKSDVYQVFVKVEIIEF